SHKSAMQVSNKLGALLTAVTAAVFVSSCLANTHNAILGGWSQMKQSDMDSDVFRECLDAAAAEYNARLASSDGDSSVKATVGRVSQAQQQVVSGMKYKFKASMTVPGCDSCEDRSCEFVVWYRAWMPERAKVLSVNC
ncbi:hypothetical protein BOX15_Mlig009207g3, partial [Macrostomum lignano]